MCIMRHAIETAPTPFRLWSFDDDSLHNSNHADIESNDQEFGEGDTNERDGGTSGAVNNDEYREDYEYTRARCSSRSQSYLKPMII